MQYPRNTSVFCSLNYLSRGFLSLAKPLSFSHVLESCGHGPFYVIRKPQFSKQEAGVLGLDDGLDGVPTLRSSGFSPVYEPARRHLSISGECSSIFFDLSCQVITFSKLGTSLPSVVGCHGSYGAGLLPRPQDILWSSLNGSLLFTVDHCSI